jgi:Cytochrome c554 and c-prime
LFEANMMRLLPAAILLAGLAGTVVVSGEPAGGYGRAGGARPPSNEPQSTIQQGADAPRSPTPVGLAGCASANCHGRSGGDGSAQAAWRTSCAVWAAQDPHARAYDALDPQKNAIAKKMQTAFARQEPGYHPQKDARCLACHANPGIETGDKPDLVTLRSEGVGCEACHGDATYWIHSHTLRGNELDALVGPLGVETHPRRLNDLSVRARTCAGCHVGDRKRDMNHDMIAAGHPKLNFEFASHLVRLPKHWFERDRRSGTARGPEYLAQAWVAGVLAAGEAACLLSRSRQERKDPWPELAEWNCYACHHDLLGKLWRPDAGMKLGENTWNFPWPLGDMVAANAVAEGLGAKAAEWTYAMNGPARPERLDAALTAKIGLETYSEKRSIRADAAERMFKAIEATKTLPDWDTAYRMYLTLGVLETVRRQTVKPAENPVIAAALKDVEKALNLPDHPKEATYDPKDVLTKVQKVRAELQTAWPK